jgi:hypothetical protein
MTRNHFEGLGALPPGHKFNDGLSPMIAPVTASIFAGGATRREHDLLGEAEVPADAYWGIHTLRAVENFPITGIPIGHFPELIRISRDPLAAKDSGSRRTKARTRQIWARSDNMTILAREALLADSAASETRSEWGCCSALWVTTRRLPWRHDGAMILCP